MKQYRLVIAASAFALLAACSSVGNVDPSALIQSGQLATQAATLSDTDVRALSDKSCAQLDSENKIAAPNSKYQKRLDKIAAQLGDNINGTPVNYKVYLTKDVNAWAMANGCVRVYSGLMDMMNDSEVRGVVGHEMGHVALGHTKKAMQVAYATSAVRSVASSTGGVAAALSGSQLGEFSEKLINAQFSQAQESAADDYSFDLQKKKKLDPSGLVTAFNKLAQADGGKSSILSSHPASPARAQHIQQRIASNQ
ncbi:M48 family metallopeptidase [Paraburkholderia sp. DD10]|jgi:metalloprotease|uniref:Metalloprotease n=1 Tax=Paraburkholderia terricola TaxID=169427 RepID=A0A1M6PAQ6_9BURK|nr:MULTISPECIES: M48 family metallopeptidase [Paraburkholderia]ORC48597.1 peptidase [Burkholderia sp. A27]AXE93525.1 peptidase [Paraburkholderia terricola]MDR6409459.1 putative metalloprotease [Paraburkholderia terricola]MDR6446262.1 putative metalloprotease [Paraburkholderia terricola]MDR6483892.1 putative metalloprotease [Paraburkholderia terricola]